MLCFQVLPYKIEGLLLEETEESGPVFIEIVSLTFAVSIPRSCPVSTLHAHRNTQFTTTFIVLLKSYSSLQCNIQHCLQRDVTVAHSTEDCFSPFFPMIKKWQNFTKRGSHRAGGRQQCRCCCWVTSWFPSCLYLHSHPWSTNSGTGCSRPGQREK